LGKPSARPFFRTGLREKVTDLTECDWAPSVFAHLERREGRGVERRGVEGRRVQSGEWQKRKGCVAPAPVQNLSVSSQRPPKELDTGSCSIAASHSHIVQEQQRGRGGLLRSCGTCLPLL
ncbi:unnamed protein product, partial [Pleuronectes platessa]